MKNFLKVLIWVVIIGGVCFGIYSVLPEYPHNFVKSFIQPIIDSQAKSRITQVQNLAVEGMDNVNYKTVLEKNTGVSCWTYKKDEAEPGVEYVIYNGKGAAVNLKEYTDYNGKLSTSSVIKFEFKIVGSNVEIYPYVDGEIMNIQDGAHVDANKKIRSDILQQLYNGMKDD